MYISSISKINPSITNVSQKSLNIINFKANTTKQELELVKKAKKELEISLRKNVSDFNLKRFQPLKKLLNLTKDNEVKTLITALQAMIAASLYKPVKKELDGIEYTVHNKNVANLLRSEYSIEELDNIKKYLIKNHLFDMSDNKNYGFIIDKKRGIVKTCGASENWAMSDRAWITDILRVGDIQKIKRPKTWTKVLNTLGEYYEKQSENFSKLISNPKLYTEGDISQGIPHIFLPETLNPDSGWFNNKRLESHGLALKELCLGITDGLFRGKTYGYKTFDSIPQNILIAIDNLSKYFKAIDYPTAPSAGNWEEIPLKGGLTSDTEAIRSGLNAYRNLLYNPKYDNNAEIVKVRNKFKELNPLSKSELNKLIKDGQERVRKTYLEEAPNVRPYDSSLVFITTSDIKLSDNDSEDIQKHLEILELLEKKLVRENGIIRYAPFKLTLKDGSEIESPDSYLNLNYNIAVDKRGKLNLEWKKLLDEYGSKDCSEVEAYSERSQISTKDKEAQWFMVSEMSTGYGKQIEKLVKNAKRENRNLTDEELKLFERIKKKQTEYLNRALARISAEKPNSIHQIKANGLAMPRVTVTEAFQYVSDLNGEHKMLPGINSPLAWALVSLYKAISQLDITLRV